jgi:hypothetical protein
MSALPVLPAAKPLTAYRPYWAKRFGVAPFLPMSREEMAQLGWDSCDIIVVTGDAYVDHPSFGMAIIGRALEAQGFRVGIIAQPDWQSAEPFKALGRPNLFFGVTAGNMDSMINRYTADRKIRSDDAYTPGNEGGKRPDRAALVYSQRCREAYKDVPIIIGGIEGSLRRIAHYDYWQDKVRRSIVVDSKCDLLLYGNAERAVIEIAHRLAAREPVHNITDVRGTAFMRRTDDDSARGWMQIDSTEVDRPGRVDDHINPYLGMEEQAQAQGTDCAREAAAGADAASATAVLPGVPAGVIARSSVCPATSRSRAIRSSMHTPTACCTLRPIRAMRALWCRHTAIAMSGSIRRRSLWPRPRWTRFSIFPMRAARIRAMPTPMAVMTARPRFQPGR